MPRLAAVLSSLAIICLCPAAMAARRDATLPGASLGIDTPCAARVTISPDAGLHGQVVVTATADHREELDRLVLDSTAKAARIKTLPAGCWQPEPLGEFRPTLALAVRVPAGFGLAIDESGITAYSIGAVGGTLDMDLYGAQAVTDAFATTVTAGLSGESTVTLARVEGNTSIDLSGHGHVRIGQASMAKLTVNLSGAGVVSVAGGKIGDAALDASGAGDIQVGADVGDADVNISGVGNVHFAKVTGAVTKDVSGMGSVSVGN